MNFNNFCKDIKYSILSKLNFIHVHNLKITCKHWNSIFSDDEFWRRKLERDHNKIYLKFYNSVKNYYELYRRIYLEYGNLYHITYNREIKLREISNNVKSICDTVYHYGYYIDKNRNLCILNGSGHPDTYSDRYINQFNLSYINNIKKYDQIKIRNIFSNNDISLILDIDNNLYQIIVCNSKYTLMKISKNVNLCSIRNRHGFYLTYDNNNLYLFTFNENKTLGLVTIDKNVKTVCLGDDDDDDDFCIIYYINMNGEVYKQNYTFDNSLIFIVPEKYRVSKMFYVGNYFYFILEDFTFLSYCIKTKEFYYNPILKLKKIFITKSFALTVDSILIRSSTFEKMFHEQTNYEEIMYGVIDFNPDKDLLLRYN